MKTRGKLITIALACLLIGGVVGFFAAGRVTKKKINRMVEMQRPPMFKMRLEERLDLDERQQRQFDSLFLNHMQRMRKIDRGVHEKRRAELKTLFLELRETLDDDQVPILEEFAERLKKRDKKRRKRHHPPHPPE